MIVEISSMPIIGRVIIVCLLTLLKELVVGHDSLLVHKCDGHSLDGSIWFSDGQQQIWFSLVYVVAPLHLIVVELHDIAP